MHTETMPGIRTISGFIRWLIELQIVVAVPALMGAAILIVGAELGGGSALAHNETFQSITSYAQAVGMEGAFVSILIQARRYMYAGRTLTGIVMIVIGIVLGSVTSMAILIGNIESSFALDTGKALIFLGISAATWDTIRAIVFGVIAFADAYMFYVPQHILTEEEVQQQIHQKALRAQLQHKDAELLKQRVRNMTNFLNSPADGLDSEQLTPEQTEPIPQTVNVPEIYPAAMLPQKKVWTWKEYTDYVRDEYSVFLTSRQAMSTVMQIGHNTRSNTAGQPYVASVRRLKTYAQSVYGTKTAAV